MGTYGYIEADQRWNGAESKHTDRKGSLSMSITLNGQYYSTFVDNGDAFQSKGYI
jgi:hypothetical protein